MVWYETKIVDNLLNISDTVDDENTSKYNSQIFN